MLKMRAVDHAQHHLRLLIAAALVGVMAGTATSAGAAVDAQYDAAIAAARAGRYTEALPIIEGRYRRDPQNLSIAYDYLTVLGWAHRQSDAIAVFEKLPREGALPAFVEQAAARDYRDLGQFDKALALYRRGQREYPGRMLFIAGEILTLADSGHAEDALSRGKSLLPAHPYNLEILSATAYAAYKAGEAADATALARRVLALDPADREARRELILASEQLGDIEHAWLLARLSPDLFSADERRRLGGNRAALLVREAGATGLGDDERYRRADRAIDALDARIGDLSMEGPEATAELRRAKFDRILALSDRDRFDDVIAAYEALEKEHLPVPAYALRVVGDAYMRVRRPEAARTVYEAALADSPSDFQSNLGLFYAEIESEDFDAALTTVDGLAWREQRTVGARANPDWLRAQIAATMAKVYAGDTDEAQERIEALLAAEPDNPALLDTYGTILEDRGEPVAAERSFAKVESIRPGDHDAAVGEANVAVDRGDRTAGFAATDKLVEARIAQDLDPDHATALLRQREETLERPELKFSANQLYQAQRAPLGGDTFNLETEIFSAPIEDSYRLYADYQFATVALPEGRVSDHHMAAGVEFTARDFGASGEVTEDLIPTAHIGGKAAVSWAPDDEWRLSLLAQAFSSDTPLRALRHEITADSATFHVSWRADDMQSYSLTAELLTFSDTNFRSSMDISTTQRLITAPHFTLDVVPELYASRNTFHNAPYYNPLWDAEAAIGLDATQILYRRYDFVWLHHATMVPGIYWEHGFAPHPAAAFVYEHRLKLGDDWSGGLGVKLARHPYDSVANDSISIFANLDWRL